jgi:hypothetical protein
MNRNRKFLGMTIAQLGILGGLAGCVILLFCMVGILIVRNRSLGASQAATPTATLPATTTLIVSPTSTATETPTPVPYDQLIPAGWQQHKTSLIEIWLPPIFKKGNPKLLGDSVGTAISELFLTETKSKSSLYNMLVSVAYEPLTEESLDASLDKDIASAVDVRIVERRKVMINSNEAVRLLIETRVENVDLNSLTFVFLDGSTIWYVQYIAQINEFYQNLSMFESSVKTFRIVK